MPKNDISLLFQLQKCFAKYLPSLLAKSQRQLEQLEQKPISNMAPFPTKQQHPT